MINYSLLKTLNVSSDRRTPATGNITPRPHPGSRSWSQREAAKPCWRCGGRCEPTTLNDHTVECHGVRCLNCGMILFPGQTNDKEVQP